LTFAIDFLTSLKGTGTPEINNPRAGETDFWINYWQKNAITWQNPEVSPWLRQFERNFLAGSKPEDLTVFVPLSGKSVDMIWLLKRGMKVIGNDCSGLCCTDFFKEHNIPGYERVIVSDTITLHRSTSLPFEMYESDVYELTPSVVGPVNRILDRAALVALPPCHNDRYLQLLCNLLSESGGVTLLASVCELPSNTAPPHTYTHEQMETILMRYFGHVEHMQDYRYKLDAGHVTEPIYLLQNPSINLTDEPLDLVE